MNIHLATEKSKKANALGNFCRALVFIALLALLPTVGLSMTLAWTPSTNPAVVGFKIHYGSANRVYTTAFNVGNLTTSTTINGLVAGQTYHLAVTTYDADGNESAFSDDIIYTVPVPASGPVNNNSPAQSLVTSVGSTTEPAPAQPAATPPAITPSAGAAAVRTVSAKKVTISGSRQTAANVVANQSAKPANPLPTSRADQIAFVAKAKSAKPTAATALTTEKINRSNPASVVRADAPVSTAKSLPAVVHNPQSPRPVDTLINTVVARAAQFYSAVSPFDVRGNGQLDATEQIALVDALRHDASPLIGKNNKGSLTLSEASEVSLWVVALHQEIARFDVNGDGKLLGAELDALAAALEENDKLLPIFAPLILD